jgi:hypothetical protein
MRLQAPRARGPTPGRLVGAAIMDVLYVIESRTAAFEAARTTVEIFAAYPFQNYQPGSRSDVRTIY